MRIVSNNAFAGGSNGIGNMGTIIVDARDVTCLHISGAQRLTTQPNDILGHPFYPCPHDHALDVVKIKTDRI